jgi:hypothetical protein
MEVDRARRRFKALGRGTGTLADSPFRQPASLHEAGAPASAADARMLLNATILHDQALEVTKLLERRLVVASTSSDDGPKQTSSSRVV